MNPNVEWTDILARMPCQFFDHNGQQRGPLLQQALSNRALRFRHEAGILSWDNKDKAGQEVAQDFFRTVMGDEAVDKNSTEGFGRDLTKLEVEELNMLLQTKKDSMAQRLTTINSNQLSSSRRQIVQAGQPSHHNSHEPQGSRQQSSEFPLRSSPPQLSSTERRLPFYDGVDETAAERGLGNGVKAPNASSKRSYGALEVDEDDENVTKRRRFISPPRIPHDPYRLKDRAARERRTTNRHFSRQARTVNPSSLQCLTDDESYQHPEIPSPIGPSGSLRADYEIRKQYTQHSSHDPYRALGADAQYDTHNSSQSLKRRHDQLQNEETDQEIIQGVQSKRRRKNPTQGHGHRQYFSHAEKRSQLPNPAATSSRAPSFTSNFSSGPIQGKSLTNAANGVANHQPPLNISNDEQIQFYDIFETSDKKYEPLPVGWCFTAMPPSGAFTLMGTSVAGQDIQWERVNHNIAEPETQFGPNESRVSTNDPTGNTIWQGHQTYTRSPANFKAQTTTNGLPIFDKGLSAKQASFDSHKVGPTADQHPGDTVWQIHEASACSPGLIPDSNAESINRGGTVNNLHSASNVQEMDPHLANPTSRTNGVVTIAPNGTDNAPLSNTLNLPPSDPSGSGDSSINWEAFDFSDIDPYIVNASWMTDGNAVAAFLGDATTTWPPNKQQSADGVDDGELRSVNISPEGEDLSINNGGTSSQAQIDRGPKPSADVDTSTIVLQPEAPITQEEPVREDFLPQDPAPHHVAASGPPQAELEDTAQGGKSGESPEDDNDSLFDGDDTIPEYVSPNISYVSSD